MPAIFTHIQFGKEVAETLPAPLKDLTERYPEAFYLGTQGPDILFYHKPMKKKAKNPARALGWALHAQPSAPFFLRAAKKIYENEENRDDTGSFHPHGAQAAYLIGFLCHFILDSAAHPTIDAHSVNGLTHGKIESELDKFQFRKIGRPARGFNAATLYADGKEAQTTAAELFGVSQKEMGVAMRSMKKINRLFSHRCGFVHGFCHLALSLVGMNGSFGEMFLHKKDDARCQTLLPRLNEIYEEAKKVALQRIPLFFEKLPCYAQENKISDEFYRYDYSGIYHEEHE